MSTRSTIGVEMQDGTVNYVYCHHDGYLSGVGRTLLRHYNTREKALQIVSMGGVSCLEDTLENSVFYARDRGEDIDFSWSKSLDDHQVTQEYAYVFTKEGFWIFDCRLGKGVLTEAACDTD